jgi:hypothetical protein
MTSEERKKKGYSWNRNLVNKANELIYCDEKSQDIEQALRLMHESGDHYLLGMTYFLGDIVPHDLEKAIAFFREGAEAGSHSCQHGLAKMYDTKYGIGTDPKESFEMMNLALEMGNATALADLAYYYEFGMGCEKDYEKAFDLYSRAADLLQDAEAYCGLSRLYRQGLGTEASEEKAAEYETLAQAG